MTRINTNVSSLIAQRRLSTTNAGMQTTLTRLSTGLRINTGADDPAGLIASEGLRSDITAVNKAISNTQRASLMLGTAETALGQVSSLLNDIRGLVTEAANTGAISESEIAANQLQVDSSLEAINRIARSTTFQGRRLLDGSLDFVTNAGTGFGSVRDLTIKEANLGVTSVMDVNVSIRQAATQASLVNTFDLSGDLPTDIVFQLSGATGAEAFEFRVGTTLEQIIDAINMVSDATGVEASQGATDNLVLTSTTYGSKGLVAIEIISETPRPAPDNDFPFTAGFGGTRRATGEDIEGLVNGYAAKGDGNRLTITAATLSLDLTVADGSSTDIEFSITGGGALFQVGPEVVSNQQARMGIGSMNSAQLGGVTGRLYSLRSGGENDLSTAPGQASRIVNEVIDKVTNIRGRLGAFQRTTLESNMNSLSDTLTNLVEAESTIRDADFAKESAALTRAQILTQSGMSVLAIANQSPQNVLSLLQ
jgi:flagellin